MTVPEIVGIQPGGRTGSGSATVTPPVGAVRYIALVMRSSGSAGFTAASNWTLVQAWQSNGTAPSSGGTYWHMGIFTALASASPGSSWSHTGAEGLSVIVIGYDRDFTYSSREISLSSTTPSLSAAEAGLAIRSTFDWPDLPISVTYPANATIGRDYRASNDPSNSWAALIAVAHQIVASGSIGTSAFTVARSFEPLSMSVVLYGEEIDPPVGQSPWHIFGEVEVVPYTKINDNLVELA